MGVFRLNTVIGKYRIERFVGAGGMGEVYRAINLQNRMPVAVKALRIASESDTALVRFRNEAVIQYNLRHPNVAELYEYLEHQGVPCIVMEFIEGSTLDQWIRETGPLELSRALEILAEICDAVSYMHSRGTIHRDIKSENIRINAQGHAKLLDFGIAISRTSPALTKLGHSIGTPEKMAPEQHLGLRGDTRSDVWSLGVLLYEMLTGALPFANGNAAGLREDVLAVRYIPLTKRRPEVPKAVVRMIGSCLRLKPEDRYASSGVMLRELQQLRRDVRRPFWRGGLSANPAMAAGALVLLGLLIFLFAINISSSSNTQSSTGSQKEDPAVAQKTPSSQLEAPAAEEQAPPPKIAMNPSRSLSNLKPRPAPFAVGQPEPGTGGMEQLTVRVATYDGPAEVDNNDGQPLGLTPYPLRGPIGSRHELWLRRQGYEPRKIDVEINVNQPEVLFGLEKKERR
jgi:eukaryotic-like serine/threonine-protein kinase